MDDIKRYVKKHKLEVTIAVGVIVALLFIIVLYKSLFYSTSEKSVYGIRIRDIKEHKIESKELKAWQSDVKDMDKVTDCNVEVKGKLIKLFVTFESDVSTDDIKTKLNDVVNGIDKKITSYYDITLYAKQSKDGDMKYPVIGYKHKTSDTVSYDTF